MRAHLLLAALPLRLPLGFLLCRALCLLRRLPRRQRGGLVREPAPKGVSMLATVGFLVGEQVEGSSFLFDSQVTGPAVNHFQQVPLPFWFAIGAAIAIAESVRVQKGWQDPGQSDKLFLLKDGYQPGDLEFDPLGLGAGKSAEELDELASKELNNGRLAMIAISGMVVQELVDGLNILPADIALELGNGDLAAMERACAGKVDEAACAKAFEASLEAASRM